MAFSNQKLQPRKELYTLLPPMILKNVRSSTETVSNRKRQCFGTGKTINVGEKYINHQFRYDNRIVTINFTVDYFKG